MELKSFAQMKEQLHLRAPCTAVVAAAHDAHTLQGVFCAADEGLITPILVGEREKIIEIVSGMNRPLEELQIVSARGEEACAQQAVELIRGGQGDILVKGLLQTFALLRAVVNRESGIRRKGLLSHLAILEVPAYHKLLFVTDGGMVIAPDLEQKKEILGNAVEFCRFLGYEAPKAAALCMTEVEHPTMPETSDAAQLKRWGMAGVFGPCVVEGPISFDLATDRQSARVKGYQSPVSGDADILLVPSVTAGNLMVKALYGMAGASMAGVVLGAAVPVTVNSRGASPEEKYASILFCAAMAAQQDVGGG